MDTKKARLVGDRCTSHGSSPELIVTALFLSTLAGVVGSAMGSRHHAAGNARPPDFR